MNKYVKQYRVYFGLILGTFFCSAFSLSFIPWLNKLPENSQHTLANVIAAVFWLGLILGIVFTFVMNSKMRKARAKAYSAKKTKRQKHPGIFSFSSQPLHLAVYVGIGAGILISVADLIRTFVPTRIMFIVISATYFLIVVHAVIDGKNFKICKILSAE